MKRAGKPFICIEGLHHTYQAGTRRPVPALRGIDLTIDAGEYVAVIGANGSGKSTLLRHFNALLLPTSGNVWVADRNTSDTTNLRFIRSAVGMVFQAPDSQIVASVVEEDVAFGPENLGIPADELHERVEWALSTVGLWELRQRASHLLSAGQKQRIAIASALAMRPRCMLFDEATSMLDAVGRVQLLQTIDQLHDDGMTIVAATHNMAEAARAQRVVVLSEGRIALQGEPRSVFAQVEQLRALELDVPQATQLAWAVGERVTHFPNDVLTVAELVNSVVARLRTRAGDGS